MGLRLPEDVLRRKMFWDTRDISLLQILGVFRDTGTGQEKIDKVDMTVILNGALKLVREVNVINNRNKKSLGWGKLKTYNSGRWSYVSVEGEGATVQDCHFQGGLKRPTADRDRVIGVADLMILLIQHL